MLQLAFGQPFADQLDLHLIVVPPLQLLVELIFHVLHVGYHELLIVVLPQPL